MEYTLQVYGFLWQGSRAVYSYRITEPQALALQGDSPNPLRLAGDFQDVLDWRLVRCLRTLTNRNNTREHRKTLRGFRNGMTPARFERMFNR